MKIPTANVITNTVTPDLVTKHSPNFLYISSDVLAYYKGYTEYTEYTCILFIVYMFMSFDELFTSALSIHTFGENFCLKYYS